jgi:hypothetical protein
LTIEDFKSAVVYEDEMATELNISIGDRGRPLVPNDAAVAVVGPLRGTGGDASQQFDKMY